MNSKTLNIISIAICGIIILNEFAWLSRSKMAIIVIGICISIILNSLSMLVRNANK